MIWRSQSDILSQLTIVVGYFHAVICKNTQNGETLLTGSVVDQAALHGLLKKVRDLGLPLLSVMRVTP